MERECTLTKDHIPVGKRREGYVANKSMNKHPQSPRVTSNPPLLWQLFARLNNAMFCHHGRNINKQKLVLVGWWMFPIPPPPSRKNAFYIFSLECSPFLFFHLRAQYPSEDAALFFSLHDGTAMGEYMMDVNIEWICFFYLSDEWVTNTTSETRRVNQ